MVDCSTSDGYLYPRKVADLFHGYVTQVLESDSLFLGSYKVKVNDREMRSVACTLSVQLDIKTYMDIDLVVAVKCSGWPKSATADWLQQEQQQSETPQLTGSSLWHNQTSWVSRKTWPDLENTKTIKSNGFQLVAKPFHHSKLPFDKLATSHKTLWRLSFATAESFLLDNIDTGGLCHKKLLIILKAVRICSFAGRRETTPLIPSYHMKTLLFHESSRYPNNSDWMQDKLSIRFQCAIEDFYTCLSDMYGLTRSYWSGTPEMTHFFVPSVNLLIGRFDQSVIMHIAEKVKQIRDNPSGYIQKLLETHTGTCSAS